MEGYESRNDGSRSTRSYNTASDSADLAIRRLDRWWIEAFVRGPNVLELGCGDGVGTKMLLQRNDSLDVVEKDPVFCQQAKACGGSNLHVYNVSYERFEPSRAYDDIVLARSLDQVDDPGSLLERTLGWLGDGGRVHVVVQNAESLHRRIGKARGLLPSLTHLSAASVASGHKRVYTKAHLLAELCAAGFEVLLCKGFLLKPFDYRSLHQIAGGRDPELFSALFQVGEEVPDEICCQLYALCSARARPE